NDLTRLEEKGLVKLPRLPAHASTNGHLFYLQTDNRQQRDEMLRFLNNNRVHAVFHYLPLHSSPFFIPRHDGRALPNADRFSETILRLPFFYELPLDIIDMICEKVVEFYLS
ncbi:MAG: DegT/DnrJ/EryC1/StrS family aminotransferase, partial [Bacteroidales bacterium]|nr:DegT/DnrJ/EryC1/StrS family aminotransferase [Bacteroidales bacterium]